MPTINFDSNLCNLCGICIEKCPFDALSIVKGGIELNEKCRMCGVCVKLCPKDALTFFQKPTTDIDVKQDWNGILVFAEQELGEIHPITYELIGEAQKLADKVNYEVATVLVGGKGTAENAEKLLEYGVNDVFYYEHDGFTGFKADCYADAVADCISEYRPSTVLIGGTSVGRSFAPRLSTRFRTGLTADCTKLEMRENTDLVQIRPAFGGNIMAQILITNSRPQFATIRYKIMDKAHKADDIIGKVTAMPVSDAMVKSGIEVIDIKKLPTEKSIEEEDILVVAGRGMKNAEGVELVKKLADCLGAQVCFTRPLAESGLGDNSKQIGLSGRTVRPKLIITCGVSGAIQFMAGMNSSEMIIAINSDPNAQIFNIANYCIVDDAFEIIPKMIENIQNGKKEVV